MFSLGILEIAISEGICASPAYPQLIILRSLHQLDLRLA
jgi:hypothetical protein